MHSQIDNQTFTGLAILMVGLGLCFLIYVRTAFLKKQHHLPPGLTRIPFLGNVHQIPLQYPQRTFSTWAQKYGDVVYAQLFQKPILVLDSVQAAEHLLERRATKYSDRPRFRLLDDLIQFKPTMVFMSYGEEFRRHRKWYQTFLETKSALQGYRAAQRRETDKLLLSLVRTPDAFISHIKRFTGSLILEMAYGHSASSIVDGYIRQATNTVAAFAGAGTLVATLVDFFPILMYLPTWMPGGSFKSRAREIREMVREMMDAPFEGTQRAMESGTAKPSFTTFVIEETSQDGRLTKDDEINIKGAASLMYAAGTDTMINTLLSFVLAMVLNPKIFKKAQEEIDRVIGTTRLPGLEDRGSLPYLECVLQEVYRLNPGIPLGIPHQLREDDEYRGYHIPSGSIVVSNIWSMTRNPIIYPEPEKFRPERFQEMTAKEAEQRDPRKIVFGFGRRICPGRYFADSTIWLAMSNMLATFDISKARDSAGVEIIPEAIFLSGAVSHVSPFICDIRPRNDATIAMIAERYTNSVE